MNLVLLGAPGSGKGTQAERIQAAFGLVHVASGDSFRENLEHRTALGERASSYMTHGELVPDEITVAMIRERLGRPDTAGGVIFDGFPRTVAQAEALDQMMADLGRRIDGVFFIDVPDDELVERLAGRLICRECQAPFHRLVHPFRVCPHGTCHGEHLYKRDDDEPDTVRIRLRTFHARTGPLIERWKRQGRLTVISGSGSVDEVTRATLDAVRRLGGGAQG